MYFDIVKESKELAAYRDWPVEKARHYIEEVREITSKGFTAETESAYREALKAVDDKFGIVKGGLAVIDLDLEDVS